MMLKNNQTKSNAITATALSSHDYCGISNNDMEISSKVSHPLPETPNKILVLLRAELEASNEVSDATILAAVNNLSDMLHELNTQLKNNTA